MPDVREVIGGIVLLAILLRPSASAVTCAQTGYDAGRTGAVLYAVARGSLEGI